MHEEINAVTIRVGINGFGRIGRNFWRAVHAAQTAGPGGQARDIEIVAANDLGDMATFAHLLKYDTVLGTLDVDVHTADGAIVAGDQRITWLAERDPAALPWRDLGVDVVIESTGHFTKAEDARKHLAAGAKKVIISAPAKGEDITLVMGVNDDAYDPGRHDIISNGYLHYPRDPIVSSDIVGTPYSCIFDSELTMAIGDQVKVIGWYDNEWGYSSRLVDVAALVGGRLG